MLLSDLPVVPVDPRLEEVEEKTFVKVGTSTSVSDADVGNEVSFQKLWQFVDLFFEEVLEGESLLGFD